MNSTQTIKHLLLTLLLAAAVLPLSAKGKDKEAYLLGFAMSFKDSVVYVTDVQHLTPVDYTGHSRLLTGREKYTEQLRYHLNNVGLTDRTIVVFFNKKKKKVEKRLAKLRKRYETKRHYEWKTIPADEFRFEKLTAE